MKKLLAILLIINAFNIYQAKPNMDVADQLTPVIHSTGIINC